MGAHIRDLYIHSTPFSVGRVVIYRDPGGFEAITGKFTSNLPQGHYFPGLNLEVCSSS